MSSLSDGIARWLDRGRVRFVCASILLAIVASIAAGFASARGGQTAFGPALGADFAGFYTAGRILNTLPAERLYDLPLQNRMYHDLLPSVPADEQLIFAHAPFFALLLRPLAHLPYAWAYLGWLALTLALYLTGFFLLWSTRDPAAENDCLTLLLLFLAFEPFLVECAVGGQASAFGFVLMSAAMANLRRGRPIAAGLALAGCLYKTSLLFLLLPMLVVGRKGRILLGFLIGSGALVAISVLALGWPCTRAYLNLLAGYAQKTTGSSAIFRLHKYVDIISFFRLLIPGQALVARRAAAAVAAIALPVLAAAWWRLGGRNRELERLVWASTLSWTMVFNLYAPAYDTLIILPGVMETADRLSASGRFAPGQTERGFRFLLLLLFVVPWVTQPIALLARVQLFTLVLLALGSYQLRLAWRKAQAA